MMRKLFAHGKARMNAMTKSSLLMNAFFLMLSTFVLAIAGFIFWIIVTRSYDPTAVGLATSMISVAGLLALLSLAGFDTTFVRFLPTAKRKNDYINSGVVIVTCLSACLAVSVALVLPQISHNFALLKHPAAVVAFMAFTIITALSTLANAVFLAFKQARYTFLANTALSVVKIGLPLIVAQGNALTIFILAGGAQLVGLCLGYRWIRRRFAYRFRPTIDKQALRQVRRFSFSVYASSMFNLLPPTLLPLCIVSLLSPKDAAYYYMAFTIAGVLYTITYASMQSVFAEGSHNEASLAAALKKAALLVTALLIPGALLTALASPLLLTAFGPQYATHASALLQLFALSALAVAVYSALGAVFKVTKNLLGVVCMNITYAVVILGFSYLFLPQWGLIAVGWGWLIGNVAACVVGFMFVVIRKGGRAV